MILACLRRFKQEYEALCVTLVFLIFGCMEPPQQDVVLDPALRAHYLLITEGKTGSARVQLRQYMDEYGESSQPLFLMGLSYHHEKRYTKAVEWLTKSSAFTLEDDRYPPTWHFMGWSYYYLGNVEAAKGAFEHFLAMHPGEGDSLFALGLLEMDAGRFVEAEHLYRKSILSQQDNPEGQAKALARLGDVFASRNDLHEARELYLQAVDLNPDLYEAWYHLSVVHQRIGDDQLSFEALEESKIAKRRTLQSRYATRFPE